MVSKNTVCLWYDRDALEAARFYARPFPTARWAASCTRPAIIRRARKAMS